MAQPEAVRRQSQAAQDLMTRSGGQAGSNGKPAANNSGSDEVTQLKARVAQLEGQLTNANIRVERAEQRYTVVNGKYQAEVPRYAQEVKTLKEQLEAANARLAAGGGGSGGAPAGLAKLPNEEALVAKYGEAMVADMKAIAGGLAQGLVDAKLKDVKPPEGKPAGDDGHRQERPAGESVDVAPSAELAERYEKHLLSLVPDWVTQNDDPKFIAWLQRRDPATGVARMTILQRHHGALDASQVAEVFTAFKQNREIGSAASPQRESPAPGPGSGDGGEQPGSDGKRIWTGAEINRFYKDCALGKYRGTERTAERKRIEADIFAAQQEGRVKK